MTIMEYVDFNRLDKRFFLLDTYDGIPEQYQAGAANAELYVECYADVVRRFASYPGARIVRGVVPDTLDAVDADRIAFLSIDLNAAQPEIEAVRRLWPRMTPAGIVLLDDYAGGQAHAAQKRAFDAWSVEIGCPIFSLPTGQGLILKPSAPESATGG